ncbi:UNVERIFIED_CONTAM: hypothetical protein K2H54_017542 [Gekko kuhli]
MFVCKSLGNHPKCFPPCCGAYQPAWDFAMDLGSAGEPRGTQGMASPAVHFIQQPVAQQPEVTILQQMPWVPSSLPPSSRGGQIREDLMELMMIQNAQMHQVIMNNLAMSAVANFGLGPTQPSAQVTHLPWQVEDDEDDDPEPLVFHHHYPPSPNTAFTAWQPQPQPQPQPSAWPQPTIRHVGPDPQPAARLDDRAVPPPPPPSATGTVTADVPPASGRISVEQMQTAFSLHDGCPSRAEVSSFPLSFPEYYDFTQGRF